ncbi:aggregation factor core [Tropicibacter sp. Alg240-R139]|uniref:aggregation factor core n=1 Tax=Tropicibacter sp. Alg240-R139 TaxID=2305991 RepID=UPI0013DEAEE1|nr:aggregation factor core [Tropicibacter sp. Alg240-R139]
MSASAAQAELSVTFIESAPKDRFVISNSGSCDIVSGTLRLELSSSKGALIFDVTGSGAGVEVYQPFELIEGRSALSKIPSVMDGQTALDLDIDHLKSGASIAFTIDVDDTLGAREITVTGSEISGATLHLTQGNRTNSAAFSSAATATLPSRSC